MHELVSHHVGRPELIFSTSSLSLKKRSLFLEQRWGGCGIQEEEPKLGRRGRGERAERRALVAGDGIVGRQR